VVHAKFEWDRMRALGGVVLLGVRNFEIRLGVLELAAWWDNSARFSNFGSKIMRIFLPEQRRAIISGCFQCGVTHRLCGKVKPQEIISVTP
jgi:hypothetical protein